MSTPIFDNPGSDFDGKLIVAIHGMGDQTRNEFAQSIARLFSRHFSRQSGDTNQSALLPLGAWDTGRETPVDDKPVRFRTPNPDSKGLSSFAFAEVFWADIARSLETEDYRIEEPTHWARTVVERLAERYGGRGGLAPESMHLAGFVIEEIAETLTVIGNLAALGKLGDFKSKDLRSVLIKYLCDVQQVGDFVRQREKFRLRFFHRIQELHRQCPKAEIHIIAHSEGSVVAFFSLLSALKFAVREEVKLARQVAIARKDPFVGNAPPLEFEWIRQVRSFTTLGSPIDKHLYLWPEMWMRFEDRVGWTRLDQPIRWSNYYDYADPVGYELDTARRRMIEQWKCPAFDFSPEADIGFRRYLLPGKAHLDYFCDDQLFDFLIPYSIDGVRSPNDPKSNIWGYLCRAVPFVLVVILMLLAVFTLHRGLVGENPERTYPFSESLMNTSGSNATKGSTWGILGCTALLLGTTVLARIFRLSRAPTMWAVAAACYLAGVALFWWHPGYFTLEAALRGGAASIASQLGLSDQVSIVCRVWFVFLSILVLLTAWGFDIFLVRRKKLRPIWGVRILVFASGAMLFLLLVVPRLQDSGNTSAFSVIASWAGFVGFWWIGVLFFDLAFCWERYVNVEKSWLERVRIAAGEPSEKTTSEVRSGS